jgi:hypothetical protein
MMRAGCDAVMNCRSELGMGQMFFAFEGAPTQGLAGVSITPRSQGTLRDLPVGDRLIS